MSIGLHRQVSIDSHHTPIDDVSEHLTYQDQEIEKFEVILNEEDHQQIPTRQDSYFEFQDQPPKSPTRIAG